MAANEQKVSVTISVAPAAQQPLTVDVTGVPTIAQVGVAYSGVVKLSGGVPPYNVSVDQGALPPGLQLNQDLTITGTPSTAGDFTFELDVKDSQP